MTIRAKIHERTGCSREDAALIEMTARALNRQEQLRTIEDLRPDEFADLIDRAVRTRDAIRGRMRSALDGTETGENDG